MTGRLNFWNMMTNQYASRLFSVMSTSMISGFGFTYLNMFRKNAPNEVATNSFSPEFQECIYYKQNNPQLDLLRYFKIKNELHASVEATPTYRRLNIFE